MDYESIRLERADNGVARLVLSRPPVNVLNIEMLRELGAALDEIATDEGVRLIVLTGEGKAFSAGVDVADHTEDKVDEMLEVFHGVIRSLLSAGPPVIAAVKGAALGGGCELVLACDVVLAGADVRLGVPEIQLAVFPPVAAVLLPRLIGRQHALDLILTGRTVHAAEARELGLVCRVLSLDEFDARVADYVEGLASLSRPVLRLTKRTVVEGLDKSFDDAFRRAEERYLNDLMRLEDPHEGLAAFVEKRAPRWRNA